MFATALCTIHRPLDQGGEIEVISAPTVFLTNKDEFKQLEELGAARVATDDEIASLKAGDDDEADLIEAARVEQEAEAARVEQEAKAARVEQEAEAAKGAAKTKPVKSNGKAVEDFVG